MSKIYKTNRGTPIDIESIRMRHENEIAVGNASMNARGDVLGRRGEIVKKAAEISRHQYTESPTMEAQTTIKAPAPPEPSTTGTVTKTIARTGKKASLADPTPTPATKEVVLANGDIIVAEADQDPEGGL